MIRIVSFIDNNTGVTYTLNTRGQYTDINGRIYGLVPLAADITPAPPTAPTHTHRTEEIRSTSTNTSTGPSYNLQPAREEQAQPTNSTTLEQIESAIIAAYPRAIKLERMFNNRPAGETLEEFLEKFFTVWNNNRNTIYVDDGSVQTPTAKRRSLGDIYMICKYYYPRVTLKEVAEALYIKLPNIIEEGFRSSSCSQIHKRVWYYDPERATETLNKTSNDEYGKLHRWWIEQLSRTAVTA